jgi:hypothetical protein
MGMNQQKKQENVHEKGLILVSCGRGLVRTLKTSAGTIGLLAVTFLLLDLSYRRESVEDDEIREIKEEIRRLKEDGSQQI